MTDYMLAGSTYFLIRFTASSCSGVYSASLPLSAFGAAPLAVVRCRTPSSDVLPEVALSAYAPHLILFSSSARVQIGSVLPLQRVCLCCG